VSFDSSKVGATRDSEEFRVNTVRLAQFAAAIDDANPAHAEGRTACPTFANIPAMQCIVESLWSVTGQFGVHGEHDIHLHAPIVPGMRLFSRATVQGVQSTSAGVSIVVKGVTRTHDGKPVNEQYLTYFVPRASLPRSSGEPAPDHRMTEGATAKAPLAEARYPMAMDQTRRYADASRDYSDYALDEAAARAKGLDGILVHGMLTMALAGRLVVDKACGGDSARLKRLAVRFSRPVYLVPGQAITARIWRLGERDGRARIGFEAQNAAGDVVIRHGLAEVAA